MTDGIGTTTYTYDQLDRLTQATRGADVFAYGYDAAGRIASRTYPDSTATTYGYDNDGRMTSTTVGAAATSYLYDPAGHLTQTTLPNGVVESASYDRAGELNQLNDGFRVFAYGYDPIGNVTSRTVTGVTTTDAYDALDRLTDITSTGSTIHYGYDGVGNRTSMTDASGSTAYTYDAGDELTTAAGPAGTTNYGYDANGNETSAGLWTYTFNLANQLTAATDGTTSVSYGYDGDGNRVSSTASGATATLLWDANFVLPQLALERDSSSGLIRRYTYGVGRISMTTPQTTAYYSTDALGSVAEMSGTAGALLGRYDTNPFGDGGTSSNVDPSVAGEPFGFAGEHRDPLTGLVNLRARQYDPSTSRFLSLDPLGPQDYASSYSYVANNPLGYVDPSGKRRGTCASINCWLSNPEDLWNSIRGAGAASACVEGGRVGVKAGPWGTALGCLGVALAFDLSAEHAKKKILELGN